MLSLNFFLDKVGSVVENYLTQSLFIVCVCVCVFVSDLAVFKVFVRIFGSCPWPAVL